jgi:hypothetical protein
VQKTCRAFEQEAVEACQKVFDLAEQIVYSTSGSWMAREMARLVVGPSASLAPPAAAPQRADIFLGLANQMGWTAKSCGMEAT